MASYVLSLMVTIQQEEAIQKLFQHNDWLYIKIDGSNDVKGYSDHGPDVSNNDNTAVGCVSICVDSNVKVVSDNELHALGITVKQEIDSDDNNDDILDGDDKSKDTNTELKPRRSPRRKNTKINTVTKSKTLKNKRTGASSAKGKRTKCIASNIRKDPKDSSSSHKKRKIVDLPSSSGDSVSTDKISVKSENVGDPGTDIYTILEENPDIKHISELLKPNSVRLKQSSNESNIVSLEQQSVESNNLSLEEPTNKSSDLSLEQPTNNSNDVSLEQATDKSNDLSLEQPTNDMIPNDLDTNSYSASLSVYYCNSCCYTFPLREYFDQHKREGLCVFICQFCKEMFTFRNFMAYQEHLTKHRIHAEDKTGQQMFHCHICGQILKSNSGYRRHVLRHQKKGPHICGTCGDLFVERADLNSHETTEHRKEKVYSCGLCEVKFTRQSSLTRHAKIHRAINIIYRCPKLGCSETFSRKDGLKEHVAVMHEQKRAYPCKNCPRSFTWRSSLAAHVKASHPQ